VPPGVRWIATGAWVAASAAFIGPWWGVVAAVAAVPLVLLVGRPRLAGFVTIGLVLVAGAVVVHVVRTERPWPDAGWPRRFEWLHGLGLFAAVSLGVTLAAGSARQRRPMAADHQ
jgi:arabinofuranan 3-O-arabinosyltransferase